MAEPAVNPAPRRSSDSPKIKFGTIVNIPSAGLRGWTVRGLDPLSGRIVISKRAGDGVNLRSIDVAEYEAAEKEASKKKKRKAPPPPAFGLRQRIGGKGVSLQINEYDADSNQVLVDGVSDGKPVRRWIPRKDIDTVLKDQRDETFNKLKKELAAEKPKEEKKRSSEEEEAEEEEATASQEDEEETPEETKEEPPKQPGNEIEKAREELRQGKKAAALTAANVVNSIDSGEVTGEDVSKITKRTDERIAELQTKKETGLSPDEQSELDSLTEDKRQLPQITAYADTTAQLKHAQDELEEVKRDDTEQAAALEREIKALETLAASQRVGAQQAAGEIKIALPPQPVVSGEISAKLPGQRQGTIEAQVRFPTRKAPVGLEVTGVAPAAPVVAAAAAVSSPSEILLQAKTASTNLGDRIKKAQNAQRTIRVQLKDIGDEIAKVISQKQDALQRGNDLHVAEYDSRLNDLNGKRENLQSQQIQSLTDMTGLQRAKGRIDTLSGNLKAAKKNPPPELLAELQQIIPQGLKAEVQMPTEQIEKPQAVTMPRSFAAGIPAMPPPPPPATRAQRLRSRLQSRLGIPFQAATAAALAGETRQPTTPGEYMEGVGADALEQELSYSGGAGELAAPSYARPPVEEGGDVFQGAEAGRQRLRQLEKRQKAAKEMLQPEEPGALGEMAGELEGMFPEPGAGPSPMSMEPQEALGAARRGGQGTMSAIKRMISGRETARAAELQGRRAASQTAYQRQLKALQAKHGALAGSLGGSTSNIEGIRRIKRFYDMVKAGTGLTFVGLVITIVMLNVSMLNKYIFKNKHIPPQSFIEDLLTFWIDINVLMVMSLPIVIPLTILAVLLGGAVAGVGGIGSALGG